MYCSVSVETVNSFKNKEGYINANGFNWQIDPYCNYTQMTSQGTDTLTLTFQSWVIITLL